MVTDGMRSCGVDILVPVQAELGISPRGTIFGNQIVVAFEQNYHSMVLMALSAFSRAECYAD